ncbi:alpha/beta hydrolase fold domain-containing protein [Pontiella sulfatireligans]|uniref:Carboxylesterase NlhH n=1 Tax=Pontiella sulfatireligans TaxID=2750658 RepID=A0A6C2UX18_9BACT|nr:alpha/beta hydrolase [Pontiella sulfatireligans]VGO23396.1 Carboxylesterase NlhH [Pontiella sulfatireligans]
MKKNCILAILALTTSAVFAQRPGRSSEDNPKLAELLKLRPQLDLNRDGILTVEEALKARDRRTKQPRTNRVAPTYSDVAYGSHSSMKLDFWKAESAEPAALFVWIHGGGFRGGDKAPANAQLLEPFLKAGVSVASINYRLSGIGPYPMQMHDSARAIQFLRSKAAEWNIDPARIAVGGGSAGSGISQWLAFHDDLADPKSNDPVERLSTRVSCALALSMQSTLDPRVIKKIIPGNAFDDSALKPFYGLPADWNWETAEIDAKLDALIKDASPINHLTPDDPPVFIFHSERTRTDGNIHHPNFGTYLETAMKKQGIECMCKTDADYNSPAASYDDMVRFTLRHLVAAPLENKQ